MVCIKVWFEDSNEKERHSAEDVAKHVLDKFDSGVYTAPEIIRLQEVSGIAQFLLLS